MSVPHAVEPMLAMSGEPFDAASHIYEPKWDGIRCIVHGDTAKTPSVRLQSRNLRDISAQFPELVALEYLADASPWVLDGEVVCLDTQGRPSFDLVRDRLLLRDPGKIRRAQQQSPAIFAVFDLLFHRGHSIMTLPLEERKALLTELFQAETGALLSPWIAERGTAYFASLSEQQWEGMVAKDLSSPYTPGKRSRHWIKVRRTQQETFFIVGWVPRGRSDIGSLALAALIENSGGNQTRYRYVGHVGSGLRESERTQLLAILEPEPTIIEQLENLPSAREINSTIWTRPSLQCEVEFLMWTRAGILRHPVFRRLLAPVGEPV